MFDELQMIHGTTYKFFDTVCYSNSFYTKCIESKISDLSLNENMAEKNAVFPLDLMTSTHGVSYKARYVIAEEHLYTTMYPNGS